MPNRVLQFITSYANRALRRNLDVQPSNDRRTLLRRSDEIPGDLAVEPNLQVITDREENHPNRGRRYIRLHGDLECLAAADHRAFGTPAWQHDPLLFGIEAHAVRQDLLENREGHTVLVLECERHI